VNIFIEDVDASFEFAMVLEQGAENITHGGPQKIAAITQTR